MADAEVRVVAHAVGFEAVAEQARAATAAIERLAVAARSTTGGQMTAMRQLERDMSRVVNGARLGTTIGKDIQSGIASSIASQSFWSRTFAGVRGHLKVVGRELANSLAAGFSAGADAIRNGHGGREGRGGGHYAREHDLHGRMMVGALSLWGVKEITESASAREQARLNILGTGLIDGGNAGGPQAAALEGLAKRWSRQFGNLSTTEGLTFLKDAMQIFGGTEHLFTNNGKGSSLTQQAINGMTEIAGLMSFMKTYHGGEHAGAVGSTAMEFLNGLRSGELQGLGKNPEDLGKWLARETQISLATGVTPTQLLAAQRAAGMSFLLMNDNELGMFAGYVQENKQSAGVQLLRGFMHLGAGNLQRVRTNNALRDLGLIPNSPADLRRLQREGKIDINKSGGISHINDMSILKDYHKYNTNRFDWYAEDLYPAVRAKILHDRGYDIGDISKNPAERSKEEMTDIAKVVGEVFSQSNEATLATEGIIQYSTLKKRGANVAKAIADQQKRSKSVLHNIQAVSEQLDDLKTNLGLSILPSVTSFLSGLNSVIETVSDFTEQHKTLTHYGLFGVSSVLIGKGAWAGLKWLWRRGGFGEVFSLVEGIALGITGLVAGVTRGIGKLLGFNTKFGDIMGKGKTSGLIKKLTGWIDRIPVVGRALTLVGRLSVLLGGLPYLAALGGYEAVNKTDAGGKFWDAFVAETKYRYHQLTGADAKTLEADRKEMERTHQASNKALTEAAKSGVAWVHDKIIGPETSPTKTLDLMKRIHPKWMPKHRGVGDIPMPIRRPKVDANGNYLDPNYFGLGDSMPSLGRRRTRADIRAGQKEAASGPLPVVITNSKSESRPNVITTHVIVNVQTNADPGAIGGAVGSAVASQVQGALSDQHH